MYKTTSTRTPSRTSDPNSAMPSLRTEISPHTEEMRRWMTEVSLLGFPHFGEAATRLKRLRQKFLQCLHTHQSSRPEASDEAVPNGAGYVLSEDDVDPTCLSLLTQLDDLADRLMELDPPL